MLSTFSGDLATITQIQSRFVSMDRQFIYFRKGEAENNVIIIADWMVKLGVGLGLAHQFLTRYQELRQGAVILVSDLVAFGNFMSSHVLSDPARTLPEFREIAAPRNADITMTTERLKRVGGAVRYVPEERSGKFRFFVNEKQYCVFLRRDDGTFIGFEGDDPSLVASLKETFESEWAELGALQELVSRKVPGLREAIQTLQRR